jgi:hypothetical protein
VKVFLCALLLIQSLNVVGQLESGTLIVVNTSPDEIIVAADSRTYRGTEQSDNRCKITPLGGMIFAASGTTAHGYKGQPLLWDTHIIAKQVFVRAAAADAAQQLLLQVAKSWGREVQKKFQAALGTNPVDSFGFEGNNITSGVFAGFYNNAPLVVTVPITYEVLKSGALRVYSKVKQAPTGKALTVGHNTIANELMDGQTPRSRQWRQGPRPLANTTDGLALGAILAVELSIKYHPLVNIQGKMLPPVGGPIDVVRLRQSGLEWIQRKPNCQEK